mmetsp:Transcript_15543/g.48650  ORF Transcript_15543/g.48650 Transcript_15543/m.48650 type:complete len:304 (+) Transcript_15543:325-1236(+)
MPSPCALPKRPARPAICCVSAGSRKRICVPSNLVMDEKTTRRMFRRFSPRPITSVAHRTSTLPVLKSSARRRRTSGGNEPYSDEADWCLDDTLRRSCCTTRLEKPTTASPAVTSARLLKGLAATCRGDRRLRWCTSATSSLVYRCTKLMTMRSDAGEPMTCKWSTSSPRMARVHANPRSGSASSCASSRTPTAGRSPSGEDDRISLAALSAISTVAATCVTPPSGILRCSPVKSPTRISGNSEPSSPMRGRPSTARARLVSRSPRLAATSAARSRRGPAYVPEIEEAREDSAPYVLPEFVGPM